MATQNLNHEGDKGTQRKTFKTFVTPRDPSWLIFAVILLAGLFTFNHYGESWDDYSLQKYADYSLRTYNTWHTQGLMPITAKDLGNYGPAYVMTVALGSQSLSKILPLAPPDNRHILYFLTYLAGVWAFYEVSKRWLTPTAALYATLLFTTQPLFWGHAFMNPKDTPFLSLFLISLALGFNFFDKLPVEQSPRPSRIQLLLTALWIGSVFSLFIFTESFHNLIASLVLSAHDGKANIISLVASDILTANPEIYIQKYFVLFLRARALYFLLFTFCLLYLDRRHPFPPSHFIFLPALFLGFTTSTRILGPFAGVIVACYALRIKGKRAIPSLIAYVVLTMIFTYLTWPYLWTNPVGHFIESLQTMSRYPWNGSALFNGELYKPTNLPYSYLPVLLAVQFTEPTWILFLVGMVAASINYRQKWGLLGLTALWFMLPLVGFIATRATLYDNFRQIFFILPPIFMMAGLGLETALGWLKHPRVKLAIVGLVILPGVVAGIRLHPYEYVYYNTFVSHPDGRFELDYWAISYREAAEYVNSVAPPNTNVMAVGPGQVVDLHVREDLTVLSDDEETGEPFDYVICTTRLDLDSRSYPDAKVVHKIERSGMVFAVIKKIEK